MKYVSEVAKIVSKSKLLEFTEYKHPRLGVSFYNVDFSVLFNFPDLLSEVIKLLRIKIEKNINLGEIDYFGGILTKGVVFASILAYVFKKPLIIFDERGVEMYSGVRSGCNILLIDDVIMTGSTILKCIKRIREKIGGEVKAVTVILDRMYGGRERIEREGVKVLELANVKEVSKNLLNLGEIGKEEYEVIVSEIKE